MIFDDTLIKELNVRGLEWPPYLIGSICENVGLGQHIVWQLPNTHPFYFASVIHDFEYCYKLQKNSLAADNRMLRNFLILAGSSKARKVQAYLFYGIARVYGAIRW